MLKSICHKQFHMSRHFNFLISLILRIKMIFWIVHCSLFHGWAFFCWFSLEQDWYSTMIMKRNDTLKVDYYGELDICIVVKNLRYTIHYIFYGNWYISPSISYFKVELTTFIQYSIRYVILQYNDPYIFNYFYNFFKNQINCFFVKRLIILII